MNFTGADLARPRGRRLLLTSGCGASGDPVEGGVGNLIGLNPRRSLNHLRLELLHFGVSFAAIGIRVFFLIPETDSNRFRSAGGRQHDFVPEALLLLK